VGRLRQGGWGGCLIYGTGSVSLTPQRKGKKGGREGGAHAYLEKRPNAPSNLSFFWGGGKKGVCSQLEFVEQEALWEKGESKGGELFTFSRLLYEGGKEGRPLPDERKKKRGEKKKKVAFPGSNLPRRKDGVWQHKRCFVSLPRRGKIRLLIKREKRNLNFGAQRENAIADKVKEEEKKPTSHYYPRRGEGKKKFGVS